jgi:hypothetical protein
MGLLELKRFLDASADRSLSVAEIAAATGIPEKDIPVMLDILGWHRPKEAEAAGQLCDGACHQCPLRSVCSVGKFAPNLNIRLLYQARKVKVLV